MTPGLATAVSATAPALARPTELPPRALHRYAWGVTGYNVAVVLWGSIVRATGSGAGCGAHWPLCNGTLLQHSPRMDTIIEFTHRATSGMAVIAMLGLVCWTFFKTPARHLARWTAVAAAALTFNEALLGALLVILGKVARDQSASRGVYLSLHLANTLLLLAALALTAHFLGRQTGRMRGSVEYRGAGLALFGIVATLVVGVSGSLAALGDTLFPATSLRAAFAQDFSAKSAWLLRIRCVHPAMSVVAALFIAALLWHGVQSQRRLSIVVASLVALQMVLGVADVLLLAPTWMQITHLFGADLLWIALVVLAARLCVVPIGCPGGGRTCQLWAARRA